MADIQDTVKAVIKKHYNVQICSGCKFIMNLESGKVEFTITAGGKIFKEVPLLIKELKKEGLIFMLLQEIVPRLWKNLPALYIYLKRMCVELQIPGEKKKLLNH